MCMFEENFNIRYNVIKISNKIYTFYKEFIFKPKL